jgi:hypothetical protein
VRLIRSKGVGVFFVTQSPKDVPADVLGQLGNRVQHQLRAFTPEDSKAIKAAVTTYPHTDYDLAELLTQLGTGEAVVTVLSPKGTPTPVAHTMMRAPQSLMAPSASDLLEQTVAASPLAAKYSDALDRESAYEVLAKRLEEAPTEAEEPVPAKGEPRAPKPAKEEPGLVEQVVGSSAFRSALRSAGTVIGREITRSLFGTSRRRR